MLGQNHEHVHPNIILISRSMYIIYFHFLDCSTASIGPMFVWDNPFGFIFVRFKIEMRRLVFLRILFKAKTTMSVPFDPISFE